jgi:hypothetical protein
VILIENGGNPEKMVKEPGDIVIYKGANINKYGTD